MKDTTKGILGTLAAFFAAWSIGKELGRKFGRTTYSTRKFKTYKYYKDPNLKSSKEEKD